MRQQKGKIRTDWDRVKRESDANAPIPYDREDGPYDPNDDAAVEAHWKAATIVRRPGQRGPQKAPTKERITPRVHPSQWSSPVSSRFAVSSLLSASSAENSFAYHLARIR